MSPDRGWKKFERRLCRDMGVERQAVTGERDGADNQPHNVFVFQFKLRKVLPTYLCEWLAGIRGTGQRQGKTGVLVVKRPRQRDVDALVILSWGDFIDLTGARPHRDDDAAA